MAAQKGGVGKTTLAYELAALVDGVLVDLDFHGGGATSQWGFDPITAARAPLLDALERRADGAVPRVKQRTGRPRLVPSHPDLSAARFDADELADALAAWAEDWEGASVIVDTHPGAHWTTDGAIQVADLVLVPLPPGRNELSATRLMLDELAEFPVLLVPNMVPPSPPGRWVRDLAELAERPNVHLGPPISEHRFLRRRLLTTAVTRQRRQSARTETAALEFNAVAERARSLCLVLTTS